MNPPTIVVAGLEKLYQKLKNTNFFPNIFYAQDTNGIISATKEIKSGNPKDIFYIVADNLNQNSSFSLRDILKRLTDANINVLLVTITANGSELIKDNPKVKLITIPLTLSHVFFALNPNLTNLDMLPDRNEVLYSPDELLKNNFSFTTDDSGSSNNQNNTAFGSWQSPFDGSSNAPVAEPVNPFSISTQPSQETNQSKNPFTSPLENTQKPNIPSNWPSNTVPDNNPFTGNNSNNPFASQPSQSNSPFSSNPSIKQTQQNNVEEFNPFTSSQRQPTNQTANENFWAPPSQNTQSPQNNWAPPSQNTQSPQINWAPPSSSPTASWGQPTTSYPSRRSDSFSDSEQKRKGYVITIAVAKGGVGKSSLTLNLAAYLGLKLRKLGRNVLVIDTNFQQADTGKYIDQFTPNITQVSRDPNILSKDRINEIIIPVPRYNISVLLGPDNPDDASPQWLTGNLYSKILGLLRDKYDYILIDTPVAEKFHTIFGEFALGALDYLIVPVAPNFPTLFNADNWLKSAVTAPVSAGGFNIDRNKIGVLLNMAQDGIDCSEDDVRETLREWNFMGSIPYSKEWIKASNSFELVAGKNFHDLHATLAQILNHATGEPALLDGYDITEEEKRGFFSKFKKRK